jgi:excisionase family DNA binding protein
LPTKSSGLVITVADTTVYELIKRGEITKVKIGRLGFITSESLEAYMDRLSAASVGGDLT